jgi:hypothetical protein
MLANADIFDELEAIEKTREELKDPYQKAQLKCSVLTVKLLHNIRSNMVTVMKHLGIELIKPKVERDQSK